MTEAIAQIALSTTDFYRAIVFYEQVLGLKNCFGTVAFRGTLAGAIQQLPNPASKVRWLTDDSDFFQLEIFEFEHPEPKPLPVGYSVRHEGFNHLLIATRRLESINEEMVALGFLQPFQIIESARGRQAITFDPDGNILQITEQPELIASERDTQLIGLGLTTSQYEVCVEDFKQHFGFEVINQIFDSQEIWCNQGQLKNSTTLTLDNKYLVINEFADGIPRRSDYRLCDEGIMNFAVGYPNFDSFKQAISMTAATGMQHSIGANNREDAIGGTYCTTNAGLSVEMLFCQRQAYGAWGFDEPSQQDRTRNFNQCVAALNHYKVSE